MRRYALALFCAAPLLAQTAAGISPNLRFEVTSLEPTQGRQDSYGIRPAPGGQRYEAWNCPIQVMLQAAYRVKPDQIVGGPAWLRSDPYDMEAQAEKPSSADELHVMLVNMLVDRLHLKLHHEKRDMAMYALTVDTSGAKLTSHQAANGGELWIDQTFEKPLHLLMKATAAPMDYLAYRLSLLMDLPVVDLTGLPGDYDFTLAYTRDLPPGFPVGGKLNGEEPDTSGPTIFAALKQQLGLDLKAKKGPVDVIVIDGAQRPDAN